MIQRFRSGGYDINNIFRGITPQEVDSARKLESEMQRFKASQELGVQIFLKSIGSHCKLKIYHLLSDFHLHPFHKIQSSFLELQQCRHGMVPTLLQDLSNLLEASLPPIITNANDLYFSLQLIANIDAERLKTDPTATMPDVKKLDCIFSRLRNAVFTDANGKYLKSRKPGGALYPWVVAVEDLRNAVIMTAPLSNQGYKHLVPQLSKNSSSHIPTKAAEYMSYAASFTSSRDSSSASYRRDDDRTGGPRDRGERYHRSPSGDRYQGAYRRDDRERNGADRSRSRDRDQAQAPRNNSDRGDTNRRSPSRDRSSRSALYSDMDVEIERRNRRDRQQSQDRKTRLSKVDYFTELLAKAKKEEQESSPYRK